MKDRIKEIRASFGLSQGEFAKRLSNVTLGVNILEETVKKWEAGSETPLPSAIEALAHLSKRPIKWIQSNGASNGETQDLENNGTVKVFSEQGPKQNIVEDDKLASNSNVIQFPDKNDAD